MAWESVGAKLLPYRNKITFVAWSPDDAGIHVSPTPLPTPAGIFGQALLLTRDFVRCQAKMVYAASKEALKRSLNGIATELQANDPDDIEFETVLKTVSKGMA